MDLVLVGGNSGRQPSTFRRTLTHTRVVATGETPGNMAPMDGQLLDSSCRAVFVACDLCLPVDDKMWSSSFVVCFQSGR